MGGGREVWADLGVTEDRAGETWDSSITKFLAFNQTQYDRILHFDSDVTVLNHMDELFLLPGAQVAMLRAYWHLPKLKTLTSLFVLLEPSEFEFGRLSEVASARKENEYDMEIMDHLYGDSAMVLPHRQYGLLSGEFRSRVHANFLGNDYEPWDPERVLEEASLVHFSDWPLPKPWISWPGTLVSQMVPRCKEIGGVVNGDCRDKDIWLGLYSDFRARRKVGRGTILLFGRNGLLIWVTRTSVHFYQLLPPSGRQANYSMKRLKRRLEYKVIANSFNWLKNPLIIVQCTWMG